MEDQTARNIIRDALEGVDVRTGEELCRHLITNGLAIPVNYNDQSVRKTEVFQIREVGTDNYEQQVKKIEKKDLLGVVVTGDIPGSFIYLGIRESGFTFKIIEGVSYERHMDDFNVVSNNEIRSDFQRFSQYILNSIGEFQIVGKEDDNPVEFAKKLESAILLQIERNKVTKRDRGNARGTLLKKLFGDS